MFEREKLYTLHLKVAREARKLRMLQREMEKEDTKSSRKRKEAKHNYAAKVLKIQNIEDKYKYKY